MRRKWEEYCTGWGVARARAEHLQKFHIQKGMKLNRMQRVRKRAAYFVVA